MAFQRWQKFCQLCQNSNEHRYRLHIWKWIYPISACTVLETIPAKDFLMDVLPFLTVSTDFNHIHLLHVRKCLKSNGCPSRLIRRQILINSHYYIMGLLVLPWNSLTYGIIISLRFNSFLERERLILTDFCHRSSSQLY